LELKIKNKEKVMVKNNVEIELELKRNEGLKKLERWDDFRERRRIAWIQWSAVIYKRKRARGMLIHLWLSVIMAKNVEKFQAKIAELIKR
jgi:hypothetical protein